jgi:hypothetical protein
LRQWDQLRQLTEVLGDGRQGEFVAGAAGQRPTPSSSRNRFIVYIDDKLLMHRHQATGWS